VASLASKIAYASGLQLLFLSLTWLAGINVNGFVAIVPGTGAGAILTIPSVAEHVVLGALSAATGALIVGLALAEGSRRVVAFSVLAVAAIVVAGASGIFFVLGGASSSDQSMLMATAFIAAIFLTFLALASNNPEAGRTWRSAEVSRLSFPAGTLALVLFFGVFVTGMYVNLFVAGPVYSLPVAKQAAAFAKAEGTAGFVLHEALGGLLLLTLIVLAATLLRYQKLGVVAYSAYVGSLNLTSSGVAVVSGQGPELLSSVGLIAALVMTMLLVIKVRADRTSAT
jgi:hypothetical protein